MSMKQGEAVYQAVVNVCDPVDGKYVPTSEQRASIRQVLYEGFKSGKIVLSKDYSDEELMKYIPGLISNWLRKDKRLNGGVKYEPTNPGSRTGSGDKRLVALRGLLSTVTDAVDRAEIEEAIATRVAELKPTVTVSVADLPESLRAKYSGLTIVK